jgi:hypothetical protein
VAWVFFEFFDYFFFFFSPQFILAITSALILLHFFRTIVLIITFLRRVFADESSCSMYIKEPGADRAAVAGLVAVLILAVGAVTVLFVRQFTGQHKRSGYSRVPREEGGYEMGTSDGL